MVRRKQFKLQFKERQGKNFRKNPLSAKIRPLAGKAIKKLGRKRKPKPVKNVLQI